MLDQLSQKYEIKIKYVKLENIDLNKEILFKLNNTILS